jgi:hypothetical protein
MGTKVNSNYESLLTFTRASKGHALRPVSYGTELVTNGDFSSTDLSDWSSAIGSTATVTNGEFVVTGTSASGRQVASITTVAGKIYTLTGEARVSTGSGTALLAISDSTSGLAERGFVATSETSADNLQLVFVATQSVHYVTAGNGSSGTGDKIFDNISLKEVTFDQPDGTLTLFEHPNNVPRVEYDADGNRLGLLVEEARTNLITYSEDFSQSTWSKIRCSVSEGDITAPDGTASAFIVTPATGLNTHYIADSVSGTSGSRTISFFAKKKEYSIVFVGHGIGAQEGTYFDLDAGTITSEGTDTDASTITPLPNGWYRCAITFDSVIDPRYAILAPCESSGSTSFNPDGSSGVYVWGAQFEAGSFPTSYIKSNSGSTTTRSADVASIPVADFGYNQSAGTVVVEADSKGSDGVKYPRVVDINNGSGNERIAIWLHASDNIPRFKIDDNGVAQANISNGTLSVDVMQKYAADYNANDFAFSVEGNAVSTDTTGTVPTVTTMFIGSNQSGINQLNGHIKSIRYFPRRLTNAQLQDITS